MKKIHITCSFLLISLLFTGSLKAVLSYSMIPTVSGYTPLSGATSIGDLSAGSDLTITAPIAIGFGFKFDGVTYTQFQMSDNGYIHLGNDLFGTGYGNASGDVIVPNDFTNSNSLQPFIAPLWEELAISGLNGGGSASYKLTGSAPVRTLTIEWNRVSWRAPTSTDQISFQIVLHETSNIIDFIYKVGALGLGTFPTASIGLGGTGTTNFYSLNNSGTAPSPGFNSNTTNISTRPADGQRYRWIPTATLPIELLFFKGQNTENGNVFEWKTASEVNNNYFTLERSKDGNYFEPVAFIKGSGNSREIRSYEYTDNSFSLNDGILYYRLKQTDFDNTTDYSSVISLDIFSLHEKPPLVYFNNTTNELCISYKFSAIGKYTAEITDISGKLISRHPLEIISQENNVLKLLLSFHVEGVYIARLVEHEGTIVAQSKFIKQ